VISAVVDSPQRAHFEKKDAVPRYVRHASNMWLQWLWLFAHPTVGNLSKAFYD